MIPVPRLAVVRDAAPGAGVLRSADAMLACDERLRVVLWNEAAAALLGFTSREIVGAPCADVVRCRDASGRPRCERGGGPPDGEREAPPAFEAELRRRTGEALWVDVTSVSVRAGDGAPVLVHLLRDASRRGATEPLLAARPRLVSAREREVLTLLARGASTDAIAAALSVSRRTARNHIQNLIAKLGAHSRLEAVARASAKGLLARGPHAAEGA